MPTLYTMPGTCALAPNIAIAWLNAPIEVHNLAYGGHKAPEYLAINPKGQVPALRFDDGDVLTEASAILAWLDASYGSKDHAPNTKIGRRILEALSFMSSEVHATYGGHFNAAKFADSEAARAEVQTRTYARLRDQYARLEQTLANSGGEGLLGERTLADAFLYVLTVWIKRTPLSIDDYPALKAFRARMERDPGVLTALERQGMRPIGG